MVGACSGGLSPGHPLRRPRATPSPHGRGCSGVRRLAGGAEAGGQDRGARRDGGAGPQGADGRRRAQRRARAGRRACLDLARDGRPSGAGLRRRALPRGSARPGAGRQSRMSRRAVAIMRQNLWIAVLYNLVAVPLAIAGLRHAADRGGGDVGLVHHRHAQRAAGPRRAPVRQTSRCAGSAPAALFRQIAPATVAS